MLSKDLIVHMLVRLGQFTEWAQAGVLRIVLRYQPCTEDEAFDIMARPIRRVSAA